MATAAADVSITAIPLFSDNYCWLVKSATGLLLVDAADASPCLSALPSSSPLAAVLTTHHHRDHSGGNAEVAAAHRSAAIVGGAAEEGRVPALTLAVAGGEVLHFAGLEVRVLATPCHTRGHVCFYLPAARAVFTGDTLFLGGCGRFFEGGAETMHASLARLAALPPDTRVFCGHEYTAENLRFCASVEPGNAATAARLAEALRLRAAGLPTVGAATIADELATNVFLRAAVPAVAAAVGGGSAIEVLAALRERKNSFKAAPAGD